MKYIWNPQGYHDNNSSALRYWNCRPLEEATEWKASALDLTDPDAIAQYDPMHYKLATFMKTLDLLIEQGDAAYRQQERDTLAAAKMWYTQALALLGDKPDLPTQESSWANPPLAQAADPGRQRDQQQMLLQLRQTAATVTDAPLTDLTTRFLPQTNEKLGAYWQTLAQRLYNLRHNLSIDGQTLSLPLYAPPADPKALLIGAVNAAAGNETGPSDAMLPLYRFSVALDNAKSMVAQLAQFGGALLTLSAQMDTEALALLLQNQGCELARQSIAIQEKALLEIGEEQNALQESQRGTMARFEHYRELYKQNLTAGEITTLALPAAEVGLFVQSGALNLVGSIAETIPNIYGMAFGGAQYGAVSKGVGSLLQSGAFAMAATIGAIDRLEGFRRRRDEWKIQRDIGASNMKEIEARTLAMEIRHQAGTLQHAYQITQYTQMQEHLAFLKTRFTNKTLYSWLRGRLLAIYRQFYDLTFSRCLMAQRAYSREFGDILANFIRPGAWQGPYMGLQAGETLMLALAQMEASYWQRISRPLEVTRTVSLAQVYASLPEGAFNLVEEIAKLLKQQGDNKGEGDGRNTLVLEKNQLKARIHLADLGIKNDYPDEVMQGRRQIKQISVTLPALIGPYQDVQAIMRYDGDWRMPRGCQAIAVSHGMQDSGLFQLDFNDARSLPFEGIPIDSGSLVLNFPNAYQADGKAKQQALLLSLSDIIFHIQYTIFENEKLGHVA
jgi:hypothetical protein